MYGNEDLWALINFAGEDHTSIQTLVAFLRMLGTLVSEKLNHALDMIFVVNLLVDYISSFRLLTRKVLRKFSSCFRVKCSALLAGVPCLSVYLSMRRDSSCRSKLLEACCLIFRREMHKHLLPTWMFFKRFVVILVSCGNATFSFFMVLYYIMLPC